MRTRLLNTLLTHNVLQKVVQLYVLQVQQLPTSPKVLREHIHSTTYVYLFDPITSIPGPEAWSLWGRSRQHWVFLASPPTGLHPSWDGTVDRGGKIKLDVTVSPT